jgi:hypothetical protein
VGEDARRGGAGRGARACPGAADRCAGADASSVARHSRYWLETFLDFCERGGIGSLQSRSDGSYSLVLFDPLPSESVIWERIMATWPPA